MKTKKLTLVKRLEKAQSNLQRWQRELTLDLVGNYKYSVELDIRRIKQYANYIKNTCEMHNIDYRYLLLT